MNHVDWGLLADHLGGALADTPEQAQVACLIEADPNWRQAAAELTSALDGVAAELRSLPAPALPDEIASRLDEALRTAPSGRTSFRRRVRWAWAAAGLAGAATVAVFALGPLNLLPPQAKDSETFAANEAAEDSVGVPRFASQIDYQPETLAGSAPPVVAPLAAVDDDGTQQVRADAVPAELAELWHRPQDCLAAVTASTGSDPTVEALDFAYFVGEPALVVWLTDHGARQVVVVGPGCGPAGSDERYQTPFD